MKNKPTVSFMRNISPIFLVCFLISCISCQHKEIKERTLRWCLFSFQNSNLDTGGRPKLYIGQYLEISDTGGVKLMKRKQYNADPEYYKIILPESLINDIYSLAGNDSISIMEKYDSTSASINDNPLGAMLYFNKSRKIIAFFSHRKNRNQERLQAILENSLVNPTVIGKTQINLIDYQSFLEKQALSLLPQPPKFVKKRIKFLPP